MVPLCSLSGQGSAGALRRQVSQGHLAAAEPGLAAESRSREEAVLSNDGTAAEVGLQSYGRRAWVRECPSASACVWLRAWGTLSTAGRRVVVLLQRPLLAASEACLGSPARLIADALSAPTAGVASAEAASAFGSLQPASERLWARAFAHLARACSTARAHTGLPQERDRGVAGVGVVGCKLVGRRGRGETRCDSLWLLTDTSAGACQR